MLRSRKGILQWRYNFTVCKNIFKISKIFIAKLYISMYLIASTETGGTLPAGDPPRIARGTSIVAGILCKGLKKCQIKGELKIILCVTENSEIEIVVRDNGLDMPDDIDIQQPMSVGLHLVNGLNSFSLTA